MEADGVRFGRPSSAQCGRLKLESINLCFAACFLVMPRVVFATTHAVKFSNWSEANSAENGATKKQRFLSASDDRSLSTPLPTPTHTPLVRHAWASNSSIVVAGCAHHKTGSQLWLHLFDELSLLRTGLHTHSCGGRGCCWKSHQSASRHEEPLFCEPDPRRFFTVGNWQTPVLYWNNECSFLVKALEHHDASSQIDVRVIHSVRRPIDMVVSAFNYHSQIPAPEAWINLPITKNVTAFHTLSSALDHSNEIQLAETVSKGMTYGNLLRSVKPEEGLTVETARMWHVLTAMADDTQRLLLQPSALNIPLDWIVNNFDETLCKTFSFLLEASMRHAPSDTHVRAFMSDLMLHGRLHDASRTHKTGAHFSHVNDEEKAQQIRAVESHHFFGSKLTEMQTLIESLHLTVRDKGLC